MPVGEIKCHVLYDFTAQPGTSEININANDIITVTNQDIGEGWWEGRTASGQIGLFPASYVELIESTPAPEISPPPPPVPTHSTSVPPANEFTSAWDAPEPIPPPMPPPPPGNGTHAAHHGYGGNGTPRMAAPSTVAGWEDEDWDDDSESESQDVSAHTGNNAAGGYPNQFQFSGGGMGPGGAGPHHRGSMVSVGGGSGIGADQKLASKPKKSFNRFTAFVKSGFENYILGSKTIAVPPEFEIQLWETADGDLSWPSISPSEQYHCVVSKRGKETKMKGLKSFVMYDITPSFSGTVVSRRYKHFDWLHARLSEKYVTLPIPPLPEKQIAGRFEEDFIEHRRALLQIWVNQICAHPLISRCDVWMHFITCPDSNDKQWKLGKRKAERDELVGASLFFALKPVTDGGRDMANLEKRIEKFSRFVIDLDNAVKVMFAMACEMSKRTSYGQSREVRKIAEAFNTLAKSLGSSGISKEVALISSISMSGQEFDGIAQLYAEQPKYDFGPMSDILHQYRGLLESWREILQLHHDTLKRKREYMKLQDEGRVSSEVTAKVISRADRVTMAIMAEINHFNSERMKDLKELMRHFLDEQSKFHTEIVNRLGVALRFFES